ncbi:SSI family serine proteinase inhibitor [Streptomyces sp. NPDC020917]|uniref:SSI family serine proteinase inhibitor n=1 Tax=Streptomyces sp. NPDC020917 TaxID=3365102 RepID=UPI003797A6F9
MIRITSGSARRTASLAAAATTLAAALTASVSPLAASSAQAMGLPRMVPDRLTVSYDDGAGHARAYDLTCTRFSGGSGCAQLERIGGPVPAVPAGQACSMIYGGPERAEVSGTWDGRRVSETYRRTDGCEVSRWSRMVPALPAPGPAAQPGPLLG